MGASPRRLWLFPYLALGGDVTAGPWLLTRAARYGGPWPSDAFEHVARALIGKHRGPLGEALDTITIAVRAGDPLPDVDPITEFARLQRAVQLGVLTRNPPWQPDADGRLTSTSDNCQLHCYPLAEDQAHFVVERGAIVQVVDGGRKLADETAFMPAPLELHLGLNLIDDAVADATYNVLGGEMLPLQLPTRDDRLAHAIDWLERSWRNTPSIRWDTRSGFLKIGFEGVLGVAGRAAQASALRERFETAAAQFRGGFDDVVFDPDESESMPAKIGKAERLVTPLQHWYLEFYRHRNWTEHPDAEPVGPMYKHGTAYDGPIFLTGERVLRELLRVEMSLATRTPLFASSTYRAVLEALTEAKAHRPE